MRFNCSETQNYLKELKEKVKDIEGFWGYTIVSDVHFKLRSLS